MFVRSFGEWRRNQSMMSLPCRSLRQMKERRSRTMKCREKSDTFRPALRCLKTTWPVEQCLHIVWSMIKQEISSGIERIDAPVSRSSCLTCVRRIVVNENGGGGETREICSFLSFQGAAVNNQIWQGPENRSSMNILLILMSNSVSRARPEYSLQGSTSRSSAHRTMKKRTRCVSFESYIIWRSMKVCRRIARTSTWFDH